MKTGSAKPVRCAIYGGGSIPFESSRLGIAAFANDLNPVAGAILYATVDFPRRFGIQLVEQFELVASAMREGMSRAFEGVYPKEPDGRVEGYLWARTISCPYCMGKVPLSPNWRLGPGGTGIRIAPKCEGGPGSRGRVCEFEIVENEAQHSEGTVSDGDATCCFPDCRRVIDGNEVKRQAQSGEMGEQLFTVVYKRQIETRLKSGKRGKDKWERGYRAPTASDDNLVDIGKALSERLLEWDPRDLVPSEQIPIGNKTEEPRRYGMCLWRDIFSARQLLGHGIAVEIFQDLGPVGKLSNRNYR